MRGRALQECIQLTVQAAMTAQVPYGCSKTIYLCDDGKDDEKRKWMKQASPLLFHRKGSTKPHWLSCPQSNLNFALIP